MRTRTLVALVSLAVLTLLVVVLFGLLARSGRGPELEVRTFTLSHLEPEAAAELIRPYAFDERPGAPGELSISREPRAITVRETRDNLDRIARVLEEYDRPRPGVTLHFQIIEADGAAAADPAIADVEAALRELFRFRGYRLVAEAFVAAASFTEFQQAAAGRETVYEIQGSVRELRAQGDSGTVRLAVRLLSRRGLVLETSVNFRLGQTVVLGTGRPDPARGALILTVRAEREGA